MLKILAIDDNNDNLISLKAIINDTFPGAAVFTSLNGRKGIELAIANNPDVILLDIIMPGMDGFEVCHRLKQNEQVRDIPVVFLTALKGDKENRIKALEVGAEGFLSKPIDETELTAQIRAMVKIKAASEQKRDEKERLEKLVEERTKELVQSQAQLKGIFENLQDAYFQADLSGKLTIISPSVIRMYGFESPGEIIGQPAELFYANPQERATLISTLHVKGRIEDYVYQGRKKDGTVFWVSMNVQLIQNDEGKVIGTEGVVRDISERIKVEKALSESEEKYRLMVDLLPEAVIIHEGRKFVFANAAALKTVGADSFEQLIERPLLDYVHPDYRIFSLNRINEIYSTGQPSTFSEEKFVTLKDEILDVEVIGTPVIYMGKPAIQTIIRNITERKKAEGVLKESEERFRHISSSISDISYSCETDLIGNSTINWLYGAVEEITGYTTHELMAMKCWGKLVPDEDFPIFKSCILGVVPGQSKACQLRLKKKDESLVWIQATAECVKGTTDQNLNLIYGALVDISDQKLAERALQKSEAQFREFFEKAADAIFIAEVESGIIVDANAAASRLILRPHDELVGIHQAELHPQAKENYTTDTFKKHKEQVKNSVTTHAIENSVVRADGKEVPVEILASEVDYHGKRCMMGTFRDITERKRASEALKNSLSLTESTLESIHNGILVVDHDGRVIKTSSRFAEMWKIPECIIASGDDKILMKSILDQLTNPEEFVSKVMELYAKPESESTDLIYFKDGRIFERVSKPMLIEDVPKGRIWSFLDITDRKRAEDELRENVARLELAMSTANMSWWEMNMTTGQVVFERRKAEMLGYSPEKFNHYTDFTALVHPEDYERTMNAMRSHLDGTQDKYEVEYRIKTFSGEYKWFYDIGSVTKRDSKGKPLILSGLVLDISQRRHVDEELQNSHDMLEKLAAQVPGVLYKYRLYPDGRSAFPFSSAGMYDIYEVTPEEVREDASPVFTRLHPDDYDDIVETITESARTQKFYHSEFRVILPKRGLGWRMCDAKPERLEDGSTLWYGIITDITERKLSDLRLQASEERYRSFISQVSEGVYRFESDQPMDLNLPVEEQVDFIYDHMFISECNDAFIKMYGIADQKEMLGKGHLDFHGGRNNPVNRDTLRTFVKNNYRIENAITEEISPSGQHLSISNNSLGIIENNQLVRLWGTQTDITEKLRNDRVQHVLYTISNATLSAIDLSELIEIISNQLGKLLDSTNFYIAFYDENTNTLSTIYEKDEKDVIQHWSAEKSITGYVIKHQKSLLIRDYEIEKLIETGEVEIHGTPSKVWLGVPLNLNRKVIGAIVVQSYNNPDAYTEKDKLMLEFISHQISISIERKKGDQDLKEALVKAQESDRLKSAFLANMSHEIRTPLNSIIGFSDLLLDPNFGTHQHHEFAQMISASGNSLLTIINDIMDLSKIEAGQIQVIKAVFSIQQVLRDICKEYSYKAVEKGIELRLDQMNPTEEIFIYTDENKLKQVLINLVANAIKFTEMGFIDIGIRIKEDLIKLQVKDSGIGIPEEFHDKIFERFRQVESAETRKYGGNGLGLAISKSLVELLGGQIGIESEKGKGATFYFTFPYHYIEPEKSHE